MYANMTDFAFNLIFQIEKDREIYNSKVFRHYIRKKYGVKDQEEGTNLYIAIIKYQVKKYGKSIQPNTIYFNEDYFVKGRAVRKIKRRR